MGLHLIAHLKITFPHGGFYYQLTASITSGIPADTDLINIFATDRNFSFSRSVNEIYLISHPAFVSLFWPKFEFDSTPVTLAVKRNTNHTI